MNNLYIDRFIVKNKHETVLDIKLNSASQTNREIPFTTVLVGANGTGKSRILATLCEFFTALYDHIQNGKKLKMKNTFYYCELRIDESIYEIQIENNKVADFNPNIKLPAKVLAVAYLINDKYIFKRPNTIFSPITETSSHERYIYLGIRQSTNSAYTSSIDNNIISSLFRLLLRKEYTTISAILKVLDFDNKIRLSLKIDKRKRRKETVNNYERKNDIDIFVSQNSKIDIFPLDNNSEDALSDIVEWHRLNLLSVKLLLSKKEQSFEFTEGSSGEKQLLYTFFSIASNINDGSLVIIDEPEISLHPNWQINYISMLKNLFSNYPGCHFILATHSHYLVSDLEKDSSSLMVLHKYSDDVEISSELIEYSTYAWSAESVLYNVFNARTSRNFYFEKDLMDLIKAIENESRDIDNLTYLVSKLSKYTFDKNDPLVEIINEAERYLIDVKNTKA